MRCKTQPCSQEVWRGKVRCTYHQKIVDGLLEPADAYLSDVELNTTMGGRPHQDGRRLDHFVSDDDQP